MKKIFLFISYTFIVYSTFARDPLSLQWRPSELIAPPGETLQGVLYDYDVYDYEGTRRSTISSAGIKHANAALTLFTNPYLALPYAERYSVDIKYKILYKNFDGVERSTDELTLHIDYNPEAGTQYTAKDSYYLSDVHFAMLMIESVKVMDGEGELLDITSISELFYLRFQLDIERYYTPQRTVAPTVQLIKRSQDNGYLKFSWGPLRWAKQYDIEWTFVDDYNTENNTPVARGDLPYSFKNNSTRVTVNNSSYEIPMVFERGYILFRVRGVGFWGADFNERVTGAWSLPDEANAIPPVRFIGSSEVPNGVFQITESLQHEKGKNWQYTAAFSESGKRVDKIDYRDGTLRGRQSLTNLSTTKHLLVGETLYDHQGRPAVEILPSPVTHPADPTFSPTPTTYYATQPSLKYVPRYNVSNSFRTPYLRENFDKDRPETCDLLVQPLHNVSGSGNYYSSANPDLANQQAYVPDAEGYPFVHVEYTPDKTGRVRRQGQAGPQFQLGSGHEVKHYYAVPSQQELDRIFGNDVGVASHYKKEMTIDPNGQAHVVYKDNKGNGIASALAGQAPANLTAIERPAPQSITLNLLEEENRRETGTSSLVSSRSISISEPTTLSFNYQLTPGTYEINSCPADGTLCYDCVYDLTIQVYDDCGTMLYNVSESIGTLDSLEDCNPISFTRNTSLTVQPGGYMVSKRLTVNQQATERYVNNYLNLSCFRDQLEDRKEAEKGKVDPTACEAVCVPCAYTTLEATYTVQQPDGTTKEIVLPVEVRAKNDGTCVRTCSLNAGGCRSYYEAMLVDLSPGGQYAQYRDTTRRETNPLGEINPDAFPVSILNEENHLPALHVSWRTPLVDYKNPNGEIAYIEISDSGQPAFIASEVLHSDGKRYVKPQHLSDIKDFIAYWQSSWAESLVPYHPEYQYYVWCNQQEESHAYDSTMRITKTYADASSLNLTNHLLSGLSRDPFFERHPDGVSIMMDSLRQLFVFDTLSRPIFNIDETVYLAINCNNINYSLAEVESCARGKILYTNPTRADKEWNLYKELYLSMKGKVMNVIRHRDVLANGGFNNRLIGWGEHSALRSVFVLTDLSSLFYFGDKTKRFVEVQDAFTYLPTNPGESGNPEYATSMKEFLNVAKSSQYQRCGTCPVASEFLALLNGLASEKKLTQGVTLPDAPPLTLTRNLVDAFPISNALAYDWNPSVSSSRLRVEIKTRGALMCKIELTQEGDLVDWKTIQYFVSISENGSENKFRLRAITNDLKEIYINGYSSCLNITKCDLPPVCQSTPVLADLKLFTNYLFQADRFRQSRIRIYTAGESSSHFGLNLQAQHPGAQTWDWEYSGASAGAYTGKLIITKPGDGILSLAPVIQTCTFSFKFQNGYSFSDVYQIIGIKRANPSSKNGEKVCDGYGFLLTAINTKGIRFTIQASSSCYVTADCCIKATASCTIPFTPRVPLVSDCFEDALALAEANAERAHETAMKAEEERVRMEYIDHCLRTAEQFTLTYNESIYQYTLYYFNQAGNLVKTVPPKGVALLTNDQLNQVAAARLTQTTADDISPSHILTTTYQYNTLNDIIEKNTPDGGTTKYCYDEFGRVILSQTAQQKADRACSYLLYDAFGKVVETGKLSVSSLVFPHHVTYAEFNSAWLAGTRSEIFKTYYDKPIRAEIADWFNRQPLNLRNRVATITYQEVSDEINYDHATHYRYDLLGNINELIQENAVMVRTHPVVAEKGHHIKRVSYEYDLVSGNVNKTIYQPNQPDQFIHEYKYDADNRLLSIKTSTHPNEDELVKDIDAAFSYYKHGPMSRQVLGMEKVQGLDFAYTLQGWLKGINASTLSPDRDMGRDATLTGSISHGLVAQDAFGYSLSYFNGDYKAIGAASLGTNLFVPASTGTALEDNSLYDGSIRYLEIGNDAFGTNKVQAQAFRYDQLNRLAGMQIFRSENVRTSNAWMGGNFVNSYQNAYDYDANGNITHLSRKGIDGMPLDDLTYSYSSPNTNNQLTSIADAVTTEDPSDLETQAADNYGYDLNGRLIADVAEGVSMIAWSNSDKVKAFSKVGGAVINFTYDALGRRVTKATGEYTIYDVRDNAGNILASYKIKNDSIVWTNSPIYSDARIGIYQPNALLERNDLTHHVQVRGYKHYEMKGHTGDVLATITDRKVPSNFDHAGIFYSDISSATDYYPFGMEMPGRRLDTLKYAFGFQGMERDNEIKGIGNSYTTEFRQYDPRVGRWLSMDPQDQKRVSISPYNAFANNPVRKIDPDGLLDVDAYRRLLADPATRPADVETFLRRSEGVSLHETLTGSDGRVTGRTYRIQHNGRTFYSRVMYGSRATHPAAFRGPRVVHTESPHRGTGAYTDVDGVPIGGPDARTRGHSHLSRRDPAIVRRADDVAHGTRFRGRTRGFATVGSMVFVVVAAADAIYAISLGETTEERLQIAARVVATEAIGLALARLAPRAAGVACLVMLEGDNAAAIEEARRNRAVTEFLRANFPEAIDESRRGLFLGIIPYTLSGYIRDEVLYRQTYDMMFNTEAISEEEYTEMLGEE